ncbi:MAG: hypothetical protein FalmKO_32350 [Falsiruegeria mediterranea]
MGSDALRNGALKALISMVAWLVDDMNQRRSDALLPDRVQSMTGCAIRVKAPFSDLRIGGKSFRQNNLNERSALSCGPSCG